MKIVTLIPTLNESGTIADVVSKIRELGIVDQILVVDGGSTDGTIEKCRELGIEPIRQQRPGLGSAIRETIQHFDGDVLIIVDADGSHEISDIPRLLDKIKEGYDLVIASRYSAGPFLKGLFVKTSYSYSADDTFIRNFGNRLFTWLVQKLYKIPVHDVLMGFKAMRGELVKSLDLRSTGQEIDVEMLIKASKKGFRIGEIISREHKRVYGKSKLFAPYHGLTTLMVIIRELFRK